MNRPATHLTLLPLLVLLCAPGRAGAADDLGDDQAVASALQRAGIRALEPTPAVDFTLMDLDSRQHTLSGLQGQWVLLTFFATWCGPCKTEMPSLQALHEAWGSRGVAVVTVSVDGDTRSVERFAQRRGLQFPILMDDGKTASAYNAHAIPLSYLVDPQGRVVGLSRGARDWSKLDSLWQALTDGAPADASTGSADFGAAVRQLMELPPEVIPPTGTVDLATIRPRAGKPFFVDVVVRWEGDDYQIHPPQLELPAGLREIETATESSSIDGTRCLTYRASVVAEDAGSYAIPSVDLRFRPRSYTKEPLTSRVPGLTVRVHRRATIPWIAGIGLITGILGAAFLGAVRRRNAPSEPRE